MTQVRDRVKRASLAARYLEHQPQDFTRFIEERWNATGRVVDFLKEEVEQGAMEPIDAGKIIACSVGQLFGYQEFHSQTSPDVVQTLLGQLPDSN